MPTNLLDAWKYIETFRDIAREHGFEPSEAALLYSYCHPGIDYVVFGVDTVDQLENNLSILDRAEQFGDCYKQLHGRFNDVERKIVVPSLWR